MEKRELVKQIHDITSYATQRTHTNRIMGPKSVFMWRSIPLNQEIEPETNEMQ